MAKQKYPLRKPLILTHDELWWIILRVEERQYDLSKFLVRSQRGQKKLRGALRLLGGLQKKLYRI